METNFQSLFFTSLSVPEIKFLLRQELESFFKNMKDTSTDPENKEHFLTVKEASTFLKYSEPSLYRLISKNKIPYIKNSGKILFNKSELVAWAKEGRRKTINEISENAERHLGELGEKKRLTTHS